MSTHQNGYYGISPEQIEQLMQAARAERARTVRSFFQRLFSRKREAQAWPVPNQAFTVNC